MVGGFGTQLAEYTYARHPFSITLDTYRRLAPTRLASYRNRPGDGRSGDLA
ncbi:MAG: hypothetical protein ACI9MR_004981 [Myxococcota bacterium]|jgi:hypothetical protein